MTQGWKREPIKTDGFEECSKNQIYYLFFTREKRARPANCFLKKNEKTEMMGGRCSHVWYLITGSEMEVSR